MTKLHLPTPEECDRFNNPTGIPPSWWWERRSPSERSWPMALAPLAVFVLGVAACGLGGKLL